MESVSANLFVVRGEMDVVIIHMNNSAVSVFVITLLSYIAITFPQGWWLTALLFKSACTYHVKMQTDTLFQYLPFFFKYQRNHNSTYNMDQIGKMIFVVIGVTTDYIVCLAPLSIWVVLCFVLFSFSFLFFNFVFCFLFLTAIAMNKSWSLNVLLIWDCFLLFSIFKTFTRKR